MDNGVKQLFDFALKISTGRRGEANNDPIKLFKLEIQIQNGPKVEHLTDGPIFADFKSVVFKNWFLNSANDDTCHYFV